MESNQQENVLAENHKYLTWDGLAEIIAKMSKEARQEPVFLENLEYGNYYRATRLARTRQDEDPPNSLYFE